MNAFIAKIMTLVIALSVGLALSTNVLAGNVSTTSQTQQLKTSPSYLLLATTPKQQAKSCVLPSAQNNYCRGTSGVVNK